MKNTSSQISNLINRQTKETMNIRNVFIITLISLSSIQLCGMYPKLADNRGFNKIPSAENCFPNQKRSAEDILISPSFEKKQRTESPQKSALCLFFPKETKQGDPLANIVSEDKQGTAFQLSPFALNIKKSIYNIDHVALGNLLITNEATQLSKEEKENFHAQAKEYKQRIKDMCIIGYEITSKSDNEEIKARFSYDSEYNNAQKISRNLYAFKTLPKLTFPQAFFTNAQRYRASTPNQTPDQALLALIKNEQEKISICCFYFDLENIANKLVHKKNNGVTVEVLTTQTQKNLAALTLLAKNGISVLAPQNDPYEMNHHKFALFKRNLFDKKLLCNGSFNYTDSAIQRNWEDMTISDDADMITQFEQQFENVKNCSQPKFLENVKK